MEQTKKPIVILASGGTGGHIFPSQALAESLIEKGYQVHWFTDTRGHGYNQMPKGVKITILSLKKSKAQGPLRLVMTAIAVMMSTFSTYSKLRKIKPDLVVGFGGYPSAATMVAAILKGIPRMLHEQNAVLGRTNTLLARFAKRIALSFKNTMHVPASAKPKTRYTGTPVRTKIKALASKKYKKPEAGKDFNILVIGGSQGARIFSNVLPQALKNLSPAFKKRIQIHQQCRKETIEKTEQKFKDCKVKAEITPFVDHMDKELKWAHLVIARAGASTVSELIASKRPSILVPYPHATNNHQYYNALNIENVKGGWVLPDDKCKPARLSRMIEALMNNPDKLQHASDALSQLYEESATDALAQEVENLLSRS